jgi:hypothetical protein
MYKTKDIYIAAYITTKIGNPQDVEWQGKSCYFLFSDMSQAKKHENDYWNSGVAVAEDLFLNLKKIRARMYDSNKGFTNNTRS